ncbi:MAG: hypothetical protein CR972_03890 [Candidatus Moraniibacteriota bacterium]|nr:MAG: hypothetical protein CR972_03890 [Candidatus Moranbacteria bacterium]
MNKKITSASFFIGKQSDNLISFGSGQPDLPPPKICFDFLKDYKEFKYGEIQGKEKLRKAIAKNYPGAKKENIIITNGASEGIDLALRALYEKDAKILIPRPYYYSYPHNVKYAHMTCRYYDLVKGKIDIKNFKEKVKNCKAVIINSPGNPTGTVQEIDTLKEIEKITQKHGIYVLSDEVYKDMIYERKNYLIEGENVLTINSFSKSYSLCGARIGYIYARNHDWIKKMTEIKTHTSMNTSIVSQEMALMATKMSQKYLNDQAHIWQKRRDLIYNGIKKLGLQVWKPEGAFYVFVTIKNPQKVMEDLYYKYNIVVYNGEWFGKKDRIRLSYALDEKKIIEGLKRFKLYLENEYQK